MTHLNQSTFVFWPQGHSGVTCLFFILVVSIRLSHSLLLPGGPPGLLLGTANSFYTVQYNMVLSSPTPKIQLEITFAYSKFYRV